MVWRENKHRIKRGHRGRSRSRSKSKHDYSKGDRRRMGLLGASGMMLSMGIPSIAGGSLGIGRTPAQTNPTGMSSFFSMLIMGLLAYVIIGSIVQSIEIEYGDIGGAFGLPTSSYVSGSSGGILRFLRDFGNDIVYVRSNNDSTNGLKAGTRYGYRGVHEGMTAMDDEQGTKKDRDVTGSSSKADGAGEGEGEGEGDGAGAGANDWDKDTDMGRAERKSGMDESTDDLIILTDDDCDKMLSEDWNDELDMINNDEEMDADAKKKAEMDFISRRLKCVQRVNRRARSENRKVSILSEKVEKMANRIENAKDKSKEELNKLESAIKSQGGNKKAMGMLKVGQDAVENA